MNDLGIFGKGSTRYNTDKTPSRGNLGFASSTERIVDADDQSSDERLLFDEGLESQTISLFHSVLPRLDGYPCCDKFRCPVVANDHICYCLAMDVPKLILLPYNDVTIERWNLIDKKVTKGCCLMKDLKVKRFRCSTQFCRDSMAILAVTHSLVLWWQMITFAVTWRWMSQN
ncbi:hypothetical protein BDF20DRAFT_837707 [Mycotypha africana]|uniref:uncharacterized protein n=1 Tax=Mycotypha africana TaxID=64632 RepID=UPI0023013400|nr:uncharacterized protein BDF20DRAFT_837707 [Mycotypha africana]KAI8973809.1 hypothetical protein BDF20DRAFT_837707 [Mycotypha africana]